jgi:radical SAM superfamily enzyme YgiQ (UPF0313 family)
MKVMLISTNSINCPYPAYPLGLDYVSHAISPSHQVKIIDINEFGNYDSLKKVITDFSPGLIGLSIRNIDNTDNTDPRSFIGQYQKLTKTIRVYSKAPIVLGGSGFSIFPREIMTALKADYGIIGEGERLAELLKVLQKKEDTSNVPGLVINGSEKSSTPLLPPPFPRRFDASSSHLKYYLKKGGMLNLQTKRGCHFKCIYCTYPHIEGHKLRLIPPEQVAKTALQLQNAGAKYLFITDSAFNADYRHSIEVARAFQKVRVSIPWGAFFKPTTPHNDYYKIMADAGLTHVEFGTESLSDQVLTAYRKPFRKHHVFQSHKAANDAGVFVAHYFLMGGPGEDARSVNETLNSIGRLEKTVLFIFCGMRIYPHTTLYDIAINEAQIERHQNLLEPVFYQPKSISIKEIIKRVKKKAEEQPNLIVGSGGEETARIVAKMYERGFSGPLWELLIR